MIFLRSDLRLPEIPTTTDPELLKELTKLYSAIRTLAKNVDLGSIIKMLPFTDAITYGQAVSIYNNSGEKGRLANSTDNTKVAHGICIDSSGLILLNGIVDALSGLTPGAVYYLSTTGGNYSTIKPVNAGNIVQPVGVALSATELYFNPTLLYTQL